MQKMPIATLPLHLRRSVQRQRGIALFVVIIFVMLSMLLALWASRTAIFNEMVVGNDADYQRAFEAAQSLIQDAELDIQRFEDDTHRTDEDNVLNALNNNNIVVFTLSRSESPFCKNGLCVKRRGRQDFWNNFNDSNPDNDEDYEISINQMIADGVGAHYGKFTGAVYKDDKDADSPTHSILANTDNAKYWIEILKYADSDSVGGAGLIVNDNAAAPPADILDLRLNPSVVYRITAWAKGLKPNSTAVIQQTYARTRLQD
ncbi:MAG: pilus assembly protein PilX [Comamonas sp.]|nr:pilus assembly protein PilX [Comamonas sp.]